MYTTTGRAKPITVNAFTNRGSRFPTFHGPSRVADRGSGSAGAGKGGRRKGSGAFVLHL